MTPEQVYDRCLAIFVLSVVVFAASLVIYGAWLVSR